MCVEHTHTHAYISFQEDFPAANERWSSVFFWFSAARLAALLCVLASLKSVNTLHQHLPSPQQLLPLHLARRRSHLEQPTHGTRVAPGGPFY